MIDDSFWKIDVMTVNILQKKEKKVKLSISFLRVNDLSDLFLDNLDKDMVKMNFVVIDGLVENPLC